MNAPWIAAGAALDPNLPADRLVEPELEEMRRLLAAHAAAREQLAMLEQRLSLLIVTARDRRGMTGRVRVDPESGRLAVEGGAE